MCAWAKFLAVVLVFSWLSRDSLVVFSSLPVGHAPMVWTYLASRDSLLLLASLWGIARVVCKERKADQSRSVASGGSYASRGLVIGFEARPGGVCLTIASARPSRVLGGRDCAILSVVSSLLPRGHSRVLEVRSGSVCGTIATARLCRVLLSRDCAIVGRVCTHDARGMGVGDEVRGLGRGAPRDPS